MEQNDFMAAMQQNASAQKEEVKKEIAESLESSNNFAAEKIANGVATFTLWFGVLMCIISIFVAFSVGGGMGWSIFASGVLIFIVNLIAWSVIRMITNISYRLTRIDNKLKEQK